MSGYTPLFGSLTTGTLCGKWPDIGLWPVVLSMADWRGVIDVTPAYIAGVTGLALPEVEACMKRFCGPDPYSRSPALNGARLALLDPEHRDWGWRVVNIQKYRQLASGSDQVSDGRNAEKVRRYKERHRRTPEDTGGHLRTPTHTHTKTEEGADAPVDGLDLKAWEKWISYRQTLKPALKDVSIPLAKKSLAKHGAGQMAAVEHSIAQGYRGVYAPKNGEQPKQAGGWQ